VQVDIIEKPVIIGDAPAQTGFNIKASAFSFQVLSSGLYSDSIAAICRELSANAYDAHVMAGKSDVPFDIIIPTALSPEFEVRDYGIGMSHGDVLTIFTTYFESSKTHSNDPVGCFGLGSKSPFSYGDSFVVESRYNGTKTTYAMYIGDNGMPCVSVAGDPEEYSIEDGNGMSIKIPVKYGDFHKFDAAANNAVLYYPVKPNIIGSSVTPQIKPALYSEVTATGIRYEIIEGSGCNVAIMGPVHYPIQVGGSGFVVSDRLSNLLRQLSIRVYVPVGALSITPSREHLKYDERTTNGLKSVFEEATADLCAKFAKMVDAFDSTYSALVFASAHYNYSSPLYSILGTRATYRGSMLTQVLRPRDMCGFEDQIVIRHLRRRYRSLNACNMIEVSEKVAFLIDDVGVTVNEYKLNLTALFRSGVESLYIVRKANKKAVIDDTVIDNFMQWAGMNDDDMGKYVTRLSDLIASGAFVRPVKQKTARTSSGGEWVATCYDMVIGRSNRITPKSETSPLYYTRSCWTGRIETLADYAKSLGKLENDAKIIFGASDFRLGWLQKHTKIKSFDEFIDKEVCPSLVHIIAATDVIKSDDWDFEKYSHIHSLQFSPTSGVGELVDRAMVRRGTLAQRIGKLKEERAKIPYGVAEHIRQLGHTNVRFKKVERIAKKMYTRVMSEIQCIKTKISEEYPILDYMTSSTPVELREQYVRMVDQLNQKEQNKCN
jgi:hypothetical protein